MTTKLHRHFDIDGNELPPTYDEVSDEELAQERLERDANDAGHNCANALENWDTLTSSEQKATVRDILICIKFLLSR